MGVCVWEPLYLRVSDLQANPLMKQAGGWDVHLGIPSNEAAQMHGIPSLASLAYLLFHMSLEV